MTDREFCAMRYGAARISIALRGDRSGYAWTVEHGGRRTTADAHTLQLDEAITQAVRHARWLTADAPPHELVTK